MASETADASSLVDLFRHPRPIKRLAPQGPVLSPASLTQESLVPRGFPHLELVTVRAKLHEGTPEEFAPD